MFTIEELLGMILEDAIERGGEPEVHHYDETLNKLPNPYLEYCLSKEESSLPPIPYNLRLIRKPDGSLEWVD